MCERLTSRYCLGTCEDEGSGVWSVMTGNGAAGGAFSGGGGRGGMVDDEARIRREITEVRLRGGFVGGETKV